MVEMAFTDLTLEQILNRSEVLDCTKEYKYNEQEGIGGKPSIIAGGENLLKYTLKVKLHGSFCNPAQVIKQIEEKAHKKEIINYFQNGEYIGDFVINRFYKNIIQTIKQTIYYAEIEVDLLENPDSITEFKQNNTKAEEITTEAVNSNSSKMKKFLNQTKKMIVNNVFDSVVTTLKTGDIKELSEVGTKILNQLNSSILSEVKEAGLAQATPIVNKYANQINYMTSVLDEKQKTILKAELAKIPDTLINSALRK